MKFGFVTCVQLGLSCMEAIYEIGGRLDLAVTLRDEQARTKSGRIYLDDFCGRYGIPLLKAKNVNDDDVLAAVARAELDWLFIIGWSQIARAPILGTPRSGALGMHPTLLPVGRGRAAIPWTILKGLEQAGVTLFKLDIGVDTGEILDQVSFPVSPTATATELYAAVDAAHVALMKSAFPRLQAGDVRLRRQDEALATIWPARTMEDGEIDLDGGVADAERIVRAVTRPYPGAFLRRNGGRRVIWKAEVVSDEGDCGDSLCLFFRDGILRCLEWEDEADTQLES